MPRILVCDDNADVLATVGAALRRAGHEVTSTNSGGDALCILADDPPDLLLLDLRMPYRDGNAVLARLDPATAPPVIVMTGDAVTDPQFLGTLVRRVLRKPFQLEELLAAVNGVLADGRRPGET